MKVLATVLGGGMAGRLFVELRDKLSDLLSDAESLTEAADLEKAILAVQADLFGPTRIYLPIKKKIGAKGPVPSAAVMNTSFDDFKIDIDAGN